MSNSQVRADAAKTNREENNYGLVSLSADARMANGSNLALYLTMAIAIIGMYLEYKSWRTNKRTKRMLQGRSSNKGSTQLPKLFEKKETTAPALVSKPSLIIVKAPPCPCTGRGGHQGGTQELLSGLLPVIKQPMQLQTQFLRENTRVLTDVQDVTLDDSMDGTILTTSTPTRNPRMDARRFKFPASKKKSTSNIHSNHPNKAQKNPSSNILRVPLR